MSIRTPYPPLESPVKDFISKCLLHQANFAYIENHQIQGKVKSFKNLGLPAAQNLDPNQPEIEIKKIFLFNLGQHLPEAPKAKKRKLGPSSFLQNYHSR
jgi:hypothetical protein